MDYVTSSFASCPLSNFEVTSLRLGNLSPAALAHSVLSGTKSSEMPFSERSLLLPMVTFGELGAWKLRSSELFMESDQNTHCADL